MKPMKKLLVLLSCVAALSGCMSVARMQGDQAVNGKLVVHVSDAWNKIHDPGDIDPFDTWTREGLPLDHLRFWGGLKPGDTLMTRPMVYLRNEDQKRQRVPTFRAGLPPEKLVNLFEELYANSGAVTVTRVDPVTFAGQKGVRFEFTLARRADYLTMRGVGWVAVKRDAANGDELYAATFVAPKLAFFDRLLPSAEAVVKTARVK